MLDINKNILEKLKTYLADIDGHLLKNDFVAAEAIFETAQSLEKYFISVKDDFNEELQKYRKKIIGEFPRIKSYYTQECEIIVLGEFLDVKKLLTLPVKADSYYVRILNFQKPLPTASVGMVERAQPVSTLPQEGYLFYVKRKANFYIEIKLNPGELTQLDTQLSSQNAGTATTVISADNLTEDQVPKQGIHMLN